ncbi:MAG: 4-hydroxy-3-methylbut-2-enyl diphosphate reductase [candidate division Zixibacteria bacterium HGW-Zixibacteria-1]|nr:MAG: 4-hydroxy-3-methylbut-2-enyl diphosphate reductase [candidate division Zixibacteria bacterium HGW-Zixibacteria-1]
MIKLKKIIIARYYGFCMGVKRAISTAEETMSKGGQVTILNEIVHNDAIVRKFEEAGLAQSSSIDNIKKGTVIISAHGASPEIFQKAGDRGLNIVDATCPLVIRIHKIIHKLAEQGYQILHFGDPDHDETIGIVGHAPGRVRVIPNMEALESLGSIEGKLALTSQTTARVADFKEVEKLAAKKFPQVETFNTICNATNQRQVAVMDLAPQVDMMLVVGSSTSANSKRLAQISSAICGSSHLINTADDIKEEWFHRADGDVAVVGLSAGASTPDFLINGAIARLKELSGGGAEVVYPPRGTERNRLALKNDPS